MRIENGQIIIEDPNVRARMDARYEELRRKRTELGERDRPRLSPIPIVPVSEVDESFRTGVLPGIGRAVGQGVRNISLWGNKLGEGVSSAAGWGGARRMFHDTNDLLTRSIERTEVPEYNVGVFSEEGRHLGLATDPGYWSYNIAKIVTEMAPSAVAGMGVYGTLARAGRGTAAALEAVAKARAAKWGLRAAGAVGGLQEGVPTAEKILEKGGSKVEAAIGGAAMTIGSAILNTASFGKLVEKVGDRGLAFKIVTNALWEGGTEAAEDLPLEPLIMEAVRKADDKEWLEGAKAAANVFPLAAATGGLLGGGGGVARGREGVAAEGPEVVQPETAQPGGPGGREIRPPRPTGIEVGEQWGEEFGPREVPSGYPKGRSMEPIYSPKEEEWKEEFGPPRQTGRLGRTEEEVQADNWTRDFGGPKPEGQYREGKIIAPTGNEFRTPAAAERIARTYLEKTGREDVRLTVQRTDGGWVIVPSRVAPKQTPAGIQAAAEREAQQVRNRKKPVPAEGERIPETPVPGQPVEGELQPWRERMPGEQPVGYEEDLQFTPEQQARIEKRESVGGAQETEEALPQEPTTTTPPVVPTRGIYDPENPPKSDRAIPALRLNNGSIYYDSDKASHLEIYGDIDSGSTPFTYNDVTMDIGYIKNGKYVSGGHNVSVEMKEANERQPTVETAPEVQEKVEKQPWEMTQAEWIEKNSDVYGVPEETKDKLKKRHSFLVARAAAQGQYVPEVLSEYPRLAEKYGKSEPRTPEEVTETRGEEEKPGPELSLAEETGGKRGLPKDRVENFVRSVKESEQFPADIQVVQTVEELPEGIGDRVKQKAQGRTVRGVYDPETGTVYVVAGGVTDATEVRRVVLHETIGHSGLRGLGGQEYGANLKWMADSKKFANEINAVQEETGMDRESAAEEWFARKVEDGTVDKGLWNRFVAMMRRVLKRVGFKVEFSERDLRDLVRRAHEGARNNYELRITNGELKKEPELSTVPERAGVRGWGEKREIPRIIETEAGFVVIHPETNQPIGRFDTREEADEVNGLVDQEMEEHEKRFTLDEQTWGDRQITFWTQKYQRIKEAQGRIEAKTGEKIEDDLDVFTKIRNRDAKIAEQIKREINDAMFNAPDSFVRRILKDGITIDEFGFYVTAKHAPVANEQIAKINPDDPTLQDGGSGMTNEEAASLMAEFNKLGPERIALLEKYRQEFGDKVTRRSLELNVLSGRISKADETNMLNVYGDTYVPVKGRLEEESEDFIRDAKGISGVTPTYFHRRGRHSMPGNPFYYAIKDLEEAIREGADAEVGRALKGLILKYPSKHWSIQPQIFKTHKDKKTGKFLYADPLVKVGDNDVRIYEDGKQYIARINDKPLAAALRGHGIRKGVKLLRTLNGFLRDMFIKYSIEFWGVRNPSKDVQTMLIHIGGEHGKDVAFGALKRVPRAISAIYNNAMGKTIADKEIAASLEEYLKAGGKIGWSSYHTIEDMESIVDKAAKRIQKGQMVPEWAAKLNRLISACNEATETGTRFAVYMEMRSRGHTAQKSAILSKDATVNFMDSGLIGPWINSVFLFSGAGLNSLNRMGRAVKHKGVQKILGGLGAAGFMMSAWNRAQDPDDWEQISPVMKDTHWLIHIPGTEKYVSIPTMWIYNVPVVLGQLAEEMAFGDTTFAEAGKRFLNSFESSFNPIGGGSIKTMAVPTFFRPWVEIDANENFFGGKIHKEQSQFSGNQPDSMMYFNTVRPMTRDIMKWLNEKTGGSSERETSGWLDFNPENIDYLIDAYGGGIGKMAGNMIATGQNLLKEEKLPAIRNVPFVRVFMKEPEGQVSASRVFEMVRESRRTVFDDTQKERFMRNVERALKDGQIEAKKAKELRKEFLNNQREAQGLPKLRTKGGGRARPQRPKRPQRTQTASMNYE